MWHLMKLQALDKLFINYSGIYVGGPHTPGVNQAFDGEDHPHAELLSVGLHRTNFIFTRGCFMVYALGITASRR
ncbi:MAG: hypothetical protein M1119_06255 [Firmicutes bacterium]|nr:hypothetical protein [Bacillota bacterium]